MDLNSQQTYHQMSNLNFNATDARPLGEQRDAGNGHMMNFNQSADNIAGFAAQSPHIVNFSASGSVWSNETSRSLGILGGTSIRRVPEIENTNPIVEKPSHSDSNLFPPTDRDLALGVAHTTAVDLKGQIDDDWPTKTGTKDYTEKNLPRELMSKMFGLLKEGMYCDAVLQAGDKEIKIHKLVLLAASPFLLAKLPKPFTSQVLRLQIPENIPIEVTSQLVHYLYDGNVSLTVDNVGQFARVASLFKLEHLMHICEDFVVFFSLDDGLLNVSEEDIVILQPTIIEPKTPSVKIAEKVTTPETEISKSGSKSKSKAKTKSDEKITLKKSGTGKVRIEISPPKPIKTKEKITPTPPKVLHLYGTRAASAAAAVKGDNSNSGKLLSGSKSKDGEKLKNNEREVNLSQNSDRNVDLNPRKRRLAQVFLQEKEAEMEAKPLRDPDDVQEQEEYGDDEDIDYETDLSGSTPEKSISLNDSQKTGKRKAVKTLKKMKSVLYQSYKKGRQKKFQTAPPPAKPEVTMRPPPKKRAKEFAKSEGLSTNTSDLSNSFIDTSESAASDISPAKKAQTKKKKKKKYAVTSIKVENIQHLVLELDKQSSHIAEQERQFICDLCKNEFVFPKRSITHVIKTHEVYPEDVFKHISVRKREHTPKVCDICGYATKDQNFYYIHYHKYFRHGVPLPKGWKPFTCEICGKECFTKFQLKDHKLIHIEDTPFVCEHCGQGFKSRTCLNSHVFHRHSEVRKHECKECLKTFKTKTQLLVHVRVHTGEKPFHCPECTYNSTTRGNMRLHLVNKHKLDQQVVKNMMYQIKTLSKAFTIPSSEAHDSMYISVNVENQDGEIQETDNTLRLSLIESSRQQEADEDAALTATLDNIMATSQQSHQIVYREPTLAERHILLQSLGAQQAIIDNSLSQDQGQVQVVCQEQDGTRQEQEQQVLLPEHIQNQQILVQQNQGNTDGNILWDARTLVNVSNGGIALIQGARDLQSQDSQQIQIINSRSLIQEQHPQVTKTLHQEEGHLLGNTNNRIQTFSVERQLLEQAQSLIQGRHVEYQQDSNQTMPNSRKQNVQNSQIPAQQNQLHISRNQLIEIPVEVISGHTNPSQLVTDRQNTDISAQEQTILGNVSSLHVQEQPQSLVLKDQSATFEGVQQTSSKSPIGQTTVPLPRKQQLAALSVGVPISLSYNTSVPVTSKESATQTYIVNAQNIVTSIESARPTHQSTPVSTHSNTDMAAVQQSYEPAMTVASQGYPDANLLYQYYQQYQQGN